MKQIIWRGLVLRRVGASLPTQKHQHPRQIDPIILSTFASSRLIAGSVPSGAPFMGRSVPDDESAVPNELVPGAAAVVPEAPPVIDM
jgi:hypothetical protein